MSPIPSNLIQVAGDAMHHRVYDDQLTGMPVEEVDRYADAAVALAAVFAVLPECQELQAAIVPIVHQDSVGDWPLDSEEGAATRWWVEHTLAALARMAQP